MKLYFKGLGITLLALIPLLLLLYYILDQPRYEDVSVIGILLFIGLSLIMFIILKRLVYHSNKQLFLSATMLNILVKIIATGLFIFLYIKKTAPPNNLFVMYILAIYIAFTIFETWFMTQLAQKQPRK